ncbi:hypothetical protein [Maridesulfovibrio ferrireducens]|uniref:hypothetical protein n=1 Tax=Maridesulfovibrio ferrireducens TaxID=246191 RepID=UPI001A272E64|nr:hypothetical protein [Maridesulfovibrio ferrireducens]MBI9112885.1 hypothetical protein [Maridesulfovibrio ferrireducens]
MKKIKLIILCMATMLLLVSCGFKNADTARNSMRDVNSSAGELKNETESSQQCTEELKEKEKRDSIEEHKW